MTGAFGNKPNAKFFFMMSKGSYKQSSTVNRLEDQIGKWKNSQAAKSKGIGSQVESWNLTKRPYNPRKSKGLVRGGLGMSKDAGGITLTDVAGKRPCARTFRRYMDCMSINGFDDFNCQREKTEFFQCHDKTIAQYEDLKKKEKAGKLPPAWKPEKKSLEVVQMKNADMINREFHKMNIRVDTEAMYKTRMFLKKMESNNWYHHVDPTAKVHAHYFQIDQYLNYHSCDTSPGIRRELQMREYLGKDYRKEYMERQTHEERRRHIINQNTSV